MEEQRERSAAKPKKRAFRVGALVVVLAAGFAAARFVPDEVMRLFATVVWSMAAGGCVIGCAVSFALRRRKAAPRIAMTTVMTIVGVLAGFSASVYVLAPTMLFYPHFDEKSYAELQVESVSEELSFETEMGRMSGWMLHNAPDGAPLVLYFYGNGQNASALLRGFQENGRLDIFEGCNIAALDYPGYGMSAGEPSEASLKAFGLAAYDALAARDDVDPARIALFGYSIGTGVATYVASERAVDALVLMAPYADGYDLYNSMVDVFYGPLRGLVAFRMESIECAPDIDAPALVLSSKDDEMVPYESSKRLAAALPRSTFETFEGFGHNDYWASLEVRAEIAEFLAERR